MQRVAILHGTKGSPDGNWFPWLAGNIEKHGAEPIIVPLPTPENQNLSSWIATFEEWVPRLTNQDILVGHSLGATLTLRLLECQDTPIKATFLTSGVLGPLGNVEFDMLNSTFTANPFDWPAIQQHAGKALVYHGEDDPYVPIQQAETIGKGLQVVPRIIENGGHLNAESGFTEFETLWRDLHPILA